MLNRFCKLWKIIDSMMKTDRIGNLGLYLPFVIDV